MSFAVLTPLPAALVFRKPPPASLSGTAAAKRSTFVYCEDEPGSRAAAKLLTRDQARRIAARHHEAAPFHRNVSEIVDLNY